VPCKHLAAVFYLLAERFDEDPFALLAWRGRTREDLLTHLNANPTGAAKVVSLTELLDSFYAYPSEPDHTRSAATGTSLLNQLPPITLTARGRSLIEVLHLAYDALSANAGPHLRTGEERRSVTNADILTLKKRSQTGGRTQGETAACRRLHGLARSARSCPAGLREGVAALRAAHPRVVPASGFCWLFTNEAPLCQAAWVWWGLAGPVSD
jgi:hypothetical protein